GSADVVSGATFKAGTYSLSESSATVTSGYTASQWSCVKNGGAPASGGSITLGLGDSAVCTITNDDVAPTLKLVKTVVNDNGGTKAASDFSFQVNGGAATAFLQDGDSLHGKNNVSVNAGSYSVVEPAVSGYTTGYDGCSGTIANGETKTCTITNDDQAAHLIIVKQVINDNGGGKSASDFSGTITGVTASGGNSWTGTASPGVDKALTSVGSYSVTEGVHAGYDVSYSTDCAGTIALGQTKTCTVTNDDVQPKLTVTKVVVNDNGGTKKVSDFPLFVDSGSVISGQQGTFSAGAHTVSEAGDAAYAAAIGGDCASDGSITLNPGDVKQCTITNDD